MSTPPASLQDFIRDFADELQLTPAEITATMRLADVPRFDSMGRLSLMTMVDSKYGLLLDADAMNTCAKVADLHALILRSPRS